MLGVQFLEAVRETTNRIATNPKAFRVAASVHYWMTVVGLD
jgi:hypothetical protein